jgi:glutamyl-Q tRNA(Asp) synthetase
VSAPGIPVTRFAPSPNGALHLGHAYSALLAHDIAATLGARFLLRIEDIDQARCHRGFEAGIFDDLTWLGLTWETPVRRQSECFPAYRAAAARLEAMGVLYPCFATRAQVAKAAPPDSRHDPDGAPVYPGIWRSASPEDVARRKADGEPFALRLDMSRALEIARQKTKAQLSFRSFDLRAGERIQLAEPQIWGDVVIVRKDVPASYHLAVVVDDAAQGVTHIVRGADLLAATDLHRLLQVLLDLPEPVYQHHRLIVDASGRKLSKSHRDKALATFRAEGASPTDIRAILGLARAHG